MRKLILPLMCSSLVYMGISGCPPTDDCTPPHDGYLNAGTWGGPDWQLDLGADEIAHIQTYCATGDSDVPVQVMGGEVTFTATMQRPAGPGYVTFKAQFQGTVCDNVFTFTYTTDTGEVESGTVTYGQTGTIEPCPIL